MTLAMTPVMLWTGSNLIWVSLGMSVWNQQATNKSPSGGWTWQASKASITSLSTSEQEIRIRVRKLLFFLWKCNTWWKELLFLKDEVFAITDNYTELINNISKVLKFKHYQQYIFDRLFDFPNWPFFFPFDR